MIASEILDYYSEGKEERRLRASLGRLERIRTWEIMERHLPPAPSRLLDVGGELACTRCRWPIAVTESISLIRSRYTWSARGSCRERRQCRW